MIGKIAVTALPPGQVVGRVLVLLTNGKPAIVGSITSGLTLSGADVFEAVNVARLINRRQPRTEFT